MGVAVSVVDVLKGGVGAVILCTTTSPVSPSGQRRRASRRPGRTYGPGSRSCAANAGGACDAKAGFVEVADPGSAHLLADRAIDAFQILGLLARPRRRLAGTDMGRADEARKRLRRPVLGQKLLHIQTGPPPPGCARPYRVGEITPSGNPARVYAPATGAAWRKSRPDAPSPRSAARAGRTPCSRSMPVCIDAASAASAVTARLRLMPNEPEPTCRHPFERVALVARLPAARLARWAREDCPKGAASSSTWLLEGGLELCRSVQIQPAALSPATSA